MMNAEHRPLPILDKGHIFRGRRVQLGLTLEELRDRSGVGLNSIRRLEHGERVAFRTVLRLAPHLELSPQEAMEMFLLVERQAMAPKGRRTERSGGTGGSQNAENAHQRYCRRGEVHR
jgi:transcriptional regulator with XRE-family HTH domain